jgi:cyclophilin family peptidyl-prolyl cis-trans isomerase
MRADKAPKHVERMKTLARRGFYDNTVFHRVIEGFMAQGGDPTGTGMGGSDLPDLPAEFNDLQHLRGTASMARTNDPNSATAQFYINTVDNKMLDGRPGRPGYAVFGKVVDGMNTVDAIRAVKTGQKMANSRGGQGPMGDVPMETVEIIKVVEIPAPAMAPAAPAAK